MYIFKKLRWDCVAILTFFLFSIYLFTILTQNKFAFFGNDLIGNLASFTLIKKDLLQYHIFPQWNPFFGIGLPVVGDPLNSIYNPVVFFIFMIFPYFTAINLLYFLCIFASCVTMYYLSKYVGLNKIISLILALTYSSSGYLAARIVAGHLEKILAYPLIPPFFLLLLKLYKKPSVLSAGLLSIIISLFVLSASIYETFYAIIIISSVILLEGVKIVLNLPERKNFKKILYLLLSLFLFPLFSGIKTIPMLQANNSLERLYNPFLGSQSVVSIIYNFFLPYYQLFTSLHLSVYLNSPYLWWESFSFIGPVFFAGILLLFPFRKKTIKDVLPLLLYLSAVIIIFSMLGNPFNPFHWLLLLIPVMREFRIPSRIFIFLIPLLMTLGAIGINYLYQSKKIIVKGLIVLVLILNLFLVVTNFKEKIKSFHLPYIDNSSTDTLDYLKSSDSSDYFIGQSVLFQNQVSLYAASQNNQIIFDPNYGWGIKNLFGGNYGAIDLTRQGQYDGIYPKYFIYPNAVTPPSVFNYSMVKKLGAFSLYANSTFTPYVYTTLSPQKIYTSTSDDANIRDISIRPNTITIKAFSSSDTLNLVIAQSMYPGWKVRIDNRTVQLQRNDFLTVKMGKGIHTYIFSFSSFPFYIGIIASFLSLTTWGIYSYRLSKSLQKFK